ncbi:MAG: hypothetical protein D4R43_01045 [Sphingobacteriales bacterium]|nr:MAG: hypothetical protein D4R43_01045 [Sphingobacteriales bacterium]
MKNFKIILTFTFSFFIFNSTLAQNYHNLNTATKKALKYYSDGKDLLNVQKDAEAIKPFEQAVTEDPLFIDAWLMLGELYNENQQYEKAKNAFETSFTLKPDARSSAYYFIAESYWNLNDYENTISALKKYLTFQNLPPEWIENSKQNIANAKFAMEAVKHPVPFNPIHLSDSVNTKYQEAFPTLTADENTLVFMRRDPVAKDWNEDFYISHFNKDHWTKARNMGEALNSIYQDGAMSLTNLGNEMYFATDRSGGFGSLDIYYSHRKNGSWSEPENLGPAINSPAWETQPSISADGKTLYFVSSRPGGYGGADIYMSTKNSKGLWTTPINLGSIINTKYDEQSPFIHSDGQTLYFSSEGHPGMGDADIFYCRKDSAGKWSEPINLGYPINTKNDELSFTVSLDGKKVYYSSEKVKGDFDLYYFDMPESARPIPVTYLKGIITNQTTGDFLNADVQLINLEDGNIINSFSSDASSGEYLISIPSGKNYALNVSKKGFLFHSENFSLADHNPTEPYQLNIQLQPVKTGESVVLKNIFFETNSFELKKESTVELDKLVQLLKENAAMKIEIGGHTDNVGSDESNQKLSENRAKAVNDYLVKAGIVATRLTFKGYGKTKPIATNDTEDGQSQNRRTEFTVTSMQ